MTHTILNHKFRLSMLCASIAMALIITAPHALHAEKTTEAKPPAVPPVIDSAKVLELKKPDKFIPGKPPEPVAPPALPPKVEIPNEAPPEKLKPTPEPKHDVAKSSVTPSVSVATPVATTEPKPSKPEAGGAAVPPPVKPDAPKPDAPKPDAVVTAPPADKPADKAAPAAPSAASPAPAQPDTSFKLIPDSFIPKWLKK